MGGCVVGRARADDEVVLCCVGHCEGEGRCCRLVSFEREGEGIGGMRMKGVGFDIVVGGLAWWPVAGRTGRRDACDGDVVAFGGLGLFCSGISTFRGKSRDHEHGEPDGDSARTITLRVPLITLFEERRLCLPTYLYNHTWTSLCIASRCHDARNADCSRSHPLDMFMWA